jgi:hypothetical protein
MPAMPVNNQPDNSDKTYLGLPGWLWNSILHYVSLSILAYLGYSANAKLQTNGEQQIIHAEAQLAKQDQAIAKSEEVKQELASVKENTAAIPTSIVAVPPVIYGKLVKPADEMMDADAADDAEPAQSPQE